MIATVLGLGAAYCLTRFNFRGRGPFLSSLVGFQSIPGVMIILPLFVVFSSVGTALGIPIVGSRPALIVTYLTFAIPFATWLLVTNLRQIPMAFEEAAMIDGLSRFGALRKIIFPLMVPGMVVTLVFALLVGGTTSCSPACSPTRRPRPWRSNCSPSHRPPKPARCRCMGNSWPPR